MRNSRLTDEEIKKIRQLACKFSKMPQLLRMGDETYRQVLTGGTLTARSVERIRARLQELEA